MANNARLSNLLESIERPPVRWQQLDERAESPIRMTRGSAGWDLFTIEPLTLLPGDSRAFRLGIALEIPEGYAGQLWPRSGLAYHHAIDRLAGLIDPDYRGEVRAILINHGDEPVDFIAGERIAQLVVVPCLTELIEVDDLVPTRRGEGGFGSTGRH